MEGNIVLSICIPTYNRKKRVKELVLDLLRVRSNEFEIVVLDNASEDGTYEELKKIESTKIKLFKNEKLISGMENGLKSLTLATGRYAMQFNDRELINDINEINDIIKFLKSEDFSYIKVRESFVEYKQKYQIYEKGIMSKINIPFRGFHPTGIVVNTKYLSLLNLNNYNSIEKVSVYPHFFIEFDICKYGKTAVYNSNFWKHAERSFIKNSKSKYISNFLWFQPDGVFHTLCKYSERIIKDEDLNNKEKKDLLIRCFQDYFPNFYSYVYNFSRNEEECSHYGIEPIYLKYKDLIEILQKYKKLYVAFLKKYNMYNLKMSFYLHIKILNLLLRGIYKEIRKEKK